MSIFAAGTKMRNTMATITFSYNKRNKTAVAAIKLMESLGVFKILKDDEPNQTTVKAIKEVKAGHTYRASSVGDMMNYLRS